jgi:PAS domain S-box-containing protein
MLASYIDYKLRQRDYLLEIAKLMTSRLDLDSLLRLILRASAELLAGEVGLIVLKERDGSFRIKASYGIAPEILPYFEPFLAEIQFLKDGSLSLPQLEMRLKVVSLATGIPLRQVIALPLVAEDELLGALYIFRTTSLAFSEDEHQILAGFADQAAIAVRNARLYQEVLTEKQRLKAIIDHSADGIMILDPEGKIEVFNQAMSRITGIKPEKAIGKYCWDVLRLKDPQGKDLCQKECPFLKSSSTEQPLYIEGEIEREDGRRITVGITYARLTGADGQILSVIASVRDITHLKEAEELKTTLISAISHELKTPVAIIKGYASTLRREDAHWDEKTIKESLAAIEEESDRLSRMIDNILEASRIQAGVLKLEMGDVWIPKIADKVVDYYRRQSPKHRFEVAFPPDFPVILADEERIREVLENLVSNAVKYSPNGGMIWVGGWADKDKVYVYVVDQGIGIAEDEQEKIFERFYRADSPLKRRTKGVGLGLYIVKAIVEAHGGKIWVESKPGKGSKFIFWLPRR